MQGTTGLIAQLLYGTGMRLLEALRLRVKDVEFARREIVIREGKATKTGDHRAARKPDRPFAAAIAEGAGVARKGRAGFGRVHLPHALAVKYANAETAAGLAMGVSVACALSGSAPRRVTGALLERRHHVYPRVGAARGARGGPRWRRLTNR